MNVTMKLEREKVALSLKMLNVELEDVNQELLEIGRKPGSSGASTTTHARELMNRQTILREGQYELSQELELYDNLLRFQEQKKVKK